MRPGVIEDTAAAFRRRNTEMSKEGCLGDMNVPCFQKFASATLQKIEYCHEEVRTAGHAI